MSLPPSRAGVLALVGGELALDFTNTSSGRGSSDHKEHLQRPLHIAQWVGRARLLSTEDAVWLASEVETDKNLGARLLREALALREDIYELGAELASGRTAPRDRIDNLTRTHAGALAQARLMPIDGNFGWAWSVQDTPVAAVVGPIALSALTLLQQADLARVKQCEGHACGWLFFDSTKNKSRRWCEMSVCGNRAKQKRFGAKVHSK
jgi:predicted RNA-binding Zn ribbon-like protein